MAIVELREKSRFSNAFAKLEISATALLLPAVVWFLNAGYFLILTFVAVLAHELGHYLALRLCGGEVTRLRLSLVGATMHYIGLSYGGEVIAALSGPAASGALAVGSALLGRVFEVEAAAHLAGLSLILGVFNLLPAFPLDGGRALHAVLAHLFDLPAAELVRGAATATITAAMLALGVFLMLKTSNPTLAVAGLWLAHNAIFAKKMNKGSCLLRRAVVEWE